MWSRESEGGGLPKVETGRMSASPAASGKPVGPATAWNPGLKREPFADAIPTRLCASLGNQGGEEPADRAWGSYSAFLVHFP